MCLIDNCNRTEYSRGYCHPCYEYLRKRKLLELTVVTGKHRAKNPLYIIYNNMMQRCNNPNNTYYYNYGGRGIKVCERWLGFDGFENFAQDMGQKPSKEYSLDRIDNERGYSPDNCRWTTRVIQNHNQRVRKDNSSGYKGVHWNAKGRKWEARMSINGKIHNLGFHSTKQEAIKARKQFELERGLI